MSQRPIVAVLVGSLREDSVTRKVARALADLTPGLEFRFVEVGDLPFYNQDLETDAPPAAWTRFRNEIAAADAVLFATPEYNRSAPAPLKNAIDVGSRPWGASVWTGKPGAVISVSPGAIGGFGANQHLRQSLAVLNVPVLPQEAYIGAAFTLFDEGGSLTNETTADFLKGFGQNFVDWIGRLGAAPVARAA